MSVYYPKNKVKTNLKTNGGEFRDPQGNDYRGDYYELFNGEVRVGKFPISKDDIKLTRIASIPSRNTNVSTTNNEYLDQVEYKPQIKVINNSDNPPYFLPQPTEADYRKGAIQRYFCKRVGASNPTIIEISKDTYDDLVGKKGVYNYVLFQPTKLFWKISGPLFDDNTLISIPIAGIISTNQKIVENTNKYFKGIKSYLKDLAQFAQPQKIDILINQYTDPGLLKQKSNDEEFSGYYHVMGDGTIMDGPNHKASKKIILVAIDDLNRQKILEQVNQTISKLSLDPEERKRIFNPNLRIQSRNY